VTPEHAVQYLETLSRRYGLGDLAQDERDHWVKSLSNNPDLIKKFISQAELNIEKAAAMKKEKAA